ncbi:transcriptional regulator [Phytopseudomonas dryadis]|uniref:Transcriptional regulator n=1 Tax=Phytopseudomonas dryadis TaxID=2487520 RepID=A0A4Q9QW23_9GAMM|nr:MULTISPECIES: transcriptional regulator [Pseudomonas]TBU88283.1 transcriptional regulator [Pseudomonas dryadis]TBV05466.1 transcriptional regulator [Pseudomonas dryadis]TBV18475.1 transcriptional regulator [Pseudomonas sp. FRB 230]
MTTQAKTHNWDLIERMLHEVQNSADKPFAPRLCAEELAQALQQAGKPVANLDSLKAEAGEYEAKLLAAGFIEPRPEAEGGNGENFILTPRGLQLLSMIDSSFPGEEHPREVLDRHGLAALTPEVFDSLAPRATLV